MGRLILLGIFAIACILSGCRTKIQYVPVESVRTEYQDRYLRDSINVYDSVYVREKGDSVFVDRFQKIYIDRFRVDSFIRTDSIQVPYPVDKIVEVNKLYWYQEALMWIGVGALVILMIWLIKRKK